MILFVSVCVVITIEMIIMLRCCCCCWVGNNLGGCAAFCREDKRSCLNKRLGPRPSSLYGTTRVKGPSVHSVESIVSPLRDLKRTPDGELTESGYVPARGLTPAP